MLCLWQQGKEPIDVILEPRLQEVADARDRNLLKAMVFGALRQRGTLDWLLGRLSSSPLPRLKPHILQALRVGAYQLLFLERVPEAAAIHATVEALKKMGEPRWLTGFVNGILRNVVRRRQEFLDLLQTGKAPEEALYNHPDWLLKRWRGRYGAQGMAAICRSNSQPARLCLRVNTVKITVADFMEALAVNHIAAEPGVYIPEAVWLDQAGAVADLPGYEEGWFLIQDEIAQLIGGLIMPFPQGRCLDGCAGLGGKTAILAGLVQEGVQVVAVEPQPRRQRLFQENIARLGLANVSLFPGTLAEYAEGNSGDFAAVLIDAPCSGLGVTGRHPDIRWQRQPADLPKYQAKQVAILHEAAPLVAPGGVLVYATCSTEPEENEAVIALFQEAWPQFIIEDASFSLPPAARQLVDDQGFVRTLPGLHTSDGFFGVRLRRVQE
jgi:16S rRNA (cytosine967-C5)-methyltransferase